MAETSPVQAVWPAYSVVSAQHRNVRVLSCVSEGCSSSHLGPDIFSKAVDGLLGSVAIDVHVHFGDAGTNHWIFGNAACKADTVL